MPVPNLLFPILIVCAEMAVYLSNDMYLPALPFIARELNTTTQAVQATLTAWFFGAMTLQLIIGPVSDRIGRRPVIISGMVLFTISTLLCATAMNIDWLIFARFIQGMTVCFIVVAGYASIHESYSQAEAIQLLALMGAIIVIAPALGPLLGSFIIDIASWRWTFWALFIWGVIVLLLLWYKMFEPLPVEKRHPLEINLLLKQYIGSLTNRQFIFFMCTFGSGFCGFITWLVAGPFLVVDHFKYTPMFFGIAQVFIFSSYIIASRLVKKMMEKHGVKKLISKGLGFMLVGGIFAFVTAILFPTYLCLFVIGLMIYSFGCGFSFAPLQRLAIEAPSQPMGSRMAIVSTLLSAFCLLATALVGAFYNGTLISLAGILLVCASTSAVINTFFSKSS